MKRNKTDFALITVQSDRNTLQVLEATNGFFDRNKAFADKLSELLWAYRATIDLLPQTPENVISRHTFPLVESQYELECSIQLCKLGFYKHAIIALRNVLELGALSVYWDIDGKSHINIQEWVYSNESTPFQSKVITTLKKHKRIAVFDNKHNIIEQIKSLFGELSDFSHTKGLKFSGVELGKSNINTFNEESVQTWLQYTEKVVQIVIALHILQYPVGLQNIDLWSKFGINPPAGRFLEPHQADRIRKIFDEEVAEALQSISDADPEVRSLAQAINDMPDLTDEQVENQWEEHEKLLIQLNPLGYRGWQKSQKVIAKYELKTSPLAYIRTVMRWKRLKKWAKENGCYDKRKAVT